MIYNVRHIAVAVALLVWGTAAGAQTFEAVGTRAAGMAGAFVAVADDASAAYWNPAGFASGNFFTMVLDRTSAKSDPASPDGARKGFGLLFAMGMPALGLSYYQVRTSVLATGPTGAVRLKADPTDAGSGGRKDIGAGEVRLDTLVTHHTGATLLQSIARGIALGATLKLVRGIASSDVVPDGARESLLDGAGELSGKGTSKFDADIGVMASSGLVKAGLTIRNVTQPEFAVPGGSAALRLSRQVRAGIAIVPIAGWVVDADLDLTGTPGTSGDVRNLALGTEGRVTRKAFVRGGLRVNTGDRLRPAVATGASYLVGGSVFLDAQVTGGSPSANRGWGISARFVY